MSRSSQLSPPSPQTQRRCSAWSHDAARLEILMRARDLFEWGKIIPGVNATPDVQPGEIKRQGAKMGFNLSPEGLPPVWTGFGHSTGAKDTPNKGQKAYDDDGVNPKEIKVLKEDVASKNGDDYFD